MQEIDNGTKYLAEVLIEMGNIASSERTRLSLKEFEAANSEKEIKRQTEHIQVLNRLDTERVIEIKGLKETVSSLKMERESLTNANLRLFNELLQWRNAYPKQAKKFRPKPSPVDQEHIRVTPK